jgi:LPXTG-motif cell wall-anchored protein
MKLRVGYVQCYEQPQEGTLDATLIKVMDCQSATNGGSVQTVYTNGQTEVLYPVDPIAVDYPAPTDSGLTTDYIPPPPPPLPEDQPAESMTIIPTPTTTPTTNEGSNNILLIGGGLLFLFFLLNKKKKRKR